MAEELSSETRDQISATFASLEVGDGNRSELLAAVLKACMQITQADLGNVQLLDSAGHLRIVAQIGLSARFLFHFEHVHSGQAACGAALLRRTPIIVENVALSEFFDEESRAVLIQEGVQSVQSIPLLGTAERVVGVLSMHYLQPLQDSAAAGRVLAGLAALTTALLGGNTAFED